MNQDRMQFKAWCKLDKKMYSVGSVNLQEISHDYDLAYILRKMNKLIYYSPDEVEVFQSIGKRDKNNVLIFDGDIIGFDSSVTKGLIGVVFWNQGQCRYLVKCNNGHTYKIHPYSNSFSLTNETIEVIGHKLTHPQLVQKMHELKK